MLTGVQRARFLEKAAAYGGLRRAGEEPLEVPDAEWRRFEAILRPVRLRRDEFFVRPGEPATRFGLILSGLLRFYYVDRSGREATKAFRGPYEVAAPYAEMLLGAPSRTCIQALEDSQLLVAAHADFRRLYARHACWERVGRLMAEQFYLAKERREFEFLQLPAQERYLIFKRDFPGLAGRLPQYQIASYLGITAVALSRIRGRLRRRD